MNTSLEDQLQQLREDLALSERTLIDIQKDLHNPNLYPEPRKELLAELEAEEKKHADIKRAIEALKNKIRETQ